MQKNSDISWLWAVVVLMLVACSPSTEEVYLSGYSECKINIDQGRRDSRKMGHYSYAHESYNECMKPYRLQKDLQDWQYPQRRKSPHPAQPPKPAHPPGPPYSPKN